VLQNYCPNCGQKTSTKRFSLKNIISFEILSGIFTLDKGLLHTTKELFTRPGHSLREYMQGQRIGHFNAFSYLVLLSTVSYLLGEYSNVHLSDLMDDSQRGFASSFEEFANDYPRLIYFINIPMMAIASWLFFKRSKVNMAEHVILNTYIAGASLLMTLPLSVVGLFYDDLAVLQFLYVQIIPLLSFIYIAWVYYQFFSPHYLKKGKLVFRVLFAVFTSTLFQGIVYAAIVAVKGGLKAF